MLLTARVSNTTKKTHIDEPALRIPILVSLAAAFGGTLHLRCRFW
jgi:hypothetical protein